MVIINRRLAAEWSREMKFMIAYATISGIVFIYSLYKLRSSKESDTVIKYALMTISSAICFIYSAPYVLAFGPVGTWIIKNIY